MSRADIKELLAQHPDGLTYMELYKRIDCSHSLFVMLASLGLIGEVVYKDGRYRLSFEEWVKTVA